MTLWPLPRRAMALIALLCAAILFVCVNIIAGRVLRGDRLDLTREHLYTLSQGSRNTIAHIDEPITLRFYYSPRLGDEAPSYGVYAQRVREMLEEYAALAKGKIRLEMLNPEPFSPTEDRAVAFGLQGVPIDQGGEQVYFGLAATNSTDDQQVIPFFQPDRERFLEYDLTKLLHGLAVPKKTVVGLVTSLPLEGDFMAAMQGKPLEPYAIVDQLRQLYELRTLSTSFDKVPDDVDVLMIVHPQNLSDQTLYAIDQFVLKGGKALVFADPYSETQAAHANRFNPPGAPTSSNLDKLFAAWGVTMEPGKVAGDRRDARRVNAGTPGRSQLLEYVAWLALKEDNLNHDTLITGDLSRINMATSGILAPGAGAKTTFTPLITTSDDAEEIPVEKVEGYPDVAGLLQDFKSEGKKLTLAAQISGPADTAFPDGPPKSEAAKDKAGDKDKASAKDKNGAADSSKNDQPAAPPQIKTAAQPINVVVVGDTDILDDRFWVQVQDFFGQRVAIPSAGNGDFVANAIDVLSGGNDLIGLRTRGTSARPFEVVQNIQRVADERYQARAKGLEQELKDTQAKIRELQGKDSGNGNASVTPAAEQTKAIENFRAQMLQTRQQLRQVQLYLRQDIDRLKGRLEFFDIAFVPLLVGLAAAILGAWRLRWRRRRAHAH